MIHVNASRRWKEFYRLGTEVEDSSFSQILMWCDYSFHGIAKYESPLNQVVPCIGSGE